MIIIIIIIISSSIIESGRVETFDSNILFLLVYFRCIRVEKMNKWFPLLLLF